MNSSLPMSPSALRIEQEATRLAVDESSTFVSSLHVIKAALVVDSLAREALERVGVTSTALDRALLEIQKSRLG